MQPELLFFVGKGGVGKSTVSATTALYCAKARQKTLLVSMDPAHNQKDIFQKTFSETPCRVTPFLDVKEVDTDYWIRAYLKETEKTVKRTYSYESAFNLENYFNVLQFSPGLEEYALLLALESTLKTSASGHLKIIFDMAPTALSLRFFSLPFITLVWLEALLKLRKQILEKKEIITKIQTGSKEIETDRVKARLDVLIEKYQHVCHLFRSMTSRICLVMNDDRLSFSEAFRIKDKLSEIGIPIDSVVINKVAQHAISDEIYHTFKGQKIHLFPLASVPVYLTA